MRVHFFPYFIVKNFRSEGYARILQLHKKRKQLPKFYRILQFIWYNSIAQQWIDELIKDERVLMFTETTSHLHYANIFGSIDQLIASVDTTYLEPYG